MKDPEPQHRSTILVIGDAPSSLTQALATTATVTQASTKKAAITQLVEQPTLVVLHHTLEGADSLDFLTALTNTRQQLPPVLAIVESADSNTASRALTLQCDDILFGAPTPQELQLRVSMALEKRRIRERVEEEIDALREQSERDPLTHLYNRRAFATHALRELEKAKRKTLPVSLLIFDIDNFKAVNDTYGHGCGDRALVTLSERLRKNLRGYDLIGRHGGDELVVLLPDTDLLQSETVCHKLLTVIRETPLSTPSGPIPLFVSIGSASIATPPEQPIDTTLRCLLETADSALLAAKKAGRDRCRCLQMQPLKTSHKEMPV